MLQQVSRFCLSLFRNKSRVKGAFQRLFFKRAEHLPDTGKGIIERQLRTEENTVYLGTETYTLNESTGNYELTFREFLKPSELTRH